MSSILNDIGFDVELDLRETISLTPFQILRMFFAF